MYTDYFLCAMHYVLGTGGTAKNKTNSCPQSRGDR